MKMERYNPVSHNPLQWDPEMDECADGEYYRASDVDALLFEIRRLLAAERGENYTMMDYGPNREALDALLADTGGER